MWIILRGIHTCNNNFILIKKYVWNELTNRVEKVKIFSQGISSS